MTGARTVVQAAVHGLAAGSVARDFGLVARHVLHVAVAAHATLFSQRHARWAIAVMAAVRDGFVAAGLGLGTGTRANRWRSTARNRRLQHGLAARARNVVEDTFEAPLAAALVAVCLTAMHTAVELLVADELAHVNAARVGGVTQSRATAL